MNTTAATQNDSLPGVQHEDMQIALLKLQTIITDLTTIFGPDITYARLSHLPEISLDSSGKVLKVTGNPEEIISQVSLLFSLLSTDVASENITLRHMPKLE